MENDRLKFKNEFKDRLYKFVLELLKFINSVPKNQISHTITNQLIRSATSVLANYIEARSSGSKKEFTNFFQYSLKSANESAIWLNLLKDTDNGEKEIIERLLKELDEIAKILASSIISLKCKK